MKELRNGDRVKILPTDQLFRLLQQRGFFFDDEIRKEVSNEVGGKEGIVKEVKEKYKFDYFYFLLDGTERAYPIPYESTCQNNRDKVTFENQNIGIEPLTLNVKQLFIDVVDDFKLKVRDENGSVLKLEDLPKEELINIIYFISKKVSTILTP